MKQFNNLREEALLEKLKANDPTGKWIHDFVHSDNPKFAGKSKKERIRMALGAAYAAKRNEEVELDEASNPTDDQLHKTLANTKNMQQGVEALKKMHGMSDDEAKGHIDRLMGKNNLKTEESELGDLAHQKTLKHRFLVTYSDPKHTMVSKRKEKAQRHVLVPSTKDGQTVYTGEASALVHKHMKRQGLKVHEVEHVGMVEKKVNEEFKLDEAKPGLYANIHAKRKRIAAGSGERMRKPGSKGAPTAQSFKDAAKTANESADNQIDEISGELAQRYHDKAAKAPTPSNKKDPIKHVLNRFSSM